MALIIGFDNYYHISILSYENLSKIVIRRPNYLQTQFFKTQFFRKEIYCNFMNVSNDKTKGKKGLDETEKQNETKNGFICCRPG